MDIWDYFQQKEREFTDNSAYPDEPPVFEADPLGPGREGFITAKLSMGLQAYMGVFEWVVIQDHGTPHRLSYSYSLIYEEAFLHGWERDPYTHPECPVHEHGPEPERVFIPSPAISLSAALEAAWDELSLQEEAPP